MSEDLPEEWVDRRKVLKPLFNADKLRSSTHFTKDKLYIEGKPFTIAPENNLDEISDLLDIRASCQHQEGDVIAFLGPHSPFSNMFPSSFRLDNVRYNSVEQFLQSSKAGLFDDDITQEKVMRSDNPFRIKKLGARVHKYDETKWHAVRKELAYKGVVAKFSQNITLRDMLIDSGERKIVEGSTNLFWGTGTHLFDKNAMDYNFWKNQGGAMQEILDRVR